MDNNEDKNYLNNRSNSQNSGWNGKFLQRKKQALREQHEKRKKQQQAQQLELKKSNKMNPSVQNSNRSYSNSFLNKIPIFGISSQIYKQQTTFSIQKKSDQNSQSKKVATQQILLNGKIIKIIEKTLSNDQFRVQCQYQEQVVELIASKQEIVKNNIIPLLDFYQKILQLK